jgi:hypothetical protein
MATYNNIITKLISQVKPTDSHEYFLSLYYPTILYDVYELKKKVKSEVVACFRNHEDLKDNSNLHQIVVAKLQSVLDSMYGFESLPKGVGIFVNIRPDDIVRNKQKDIPDEDILIVPLHRKPLEEVTLEKVYDVDQLVWTSAIPDDAFIINICSDDAEIYSFNDDELKFIRKFETPYIETPKPQYQNAFRGTGTGSIIFGGSHDKHARDIETTHERFLMDVVEEIKTDKTFQKPVDFLIIFHPQSHTKFMEKAINELSASMPLTGEFINCPKQPQNPEQIKKIVQDLIEEKRKSLYQNLLKNAESLKNTYSTDLETIVSASREKKITTLFVHYNLEKEGFLQDNEHLYIEPYMNAIRVKNIIPWLIKSVHDANGRIVVFKNTEDKPQISAVFRY